MELTRYVRARNWPVAAGYALFVGMMAVGYFYNVTFVQLGLKDLGERVLDQPATTVAAQMAGLALLTCLVALAVGTGLGRRSPLSLLRKLQVAWGVVLAQTVLTAVAPLIPNPAAFWLWILFASIALGVGVPVTFSLTTDLIPVRDRGLVAAAITAVAYFIAAVFSGTWRVDALSRLLLLLLVPGAAGLGMLVLLASSGRSFVARYVAELAQNHRQPRFAHGRFLRREEGEGDVYRRFSRFVLLMFAIFFIDSLGFLRIIDTPILVTETWQAVTVQPRLVIGGAHVLTAVVAGVLYTYLREDALFYWVFAIFALSHFSYTLSTWLLPQTTQRALGTPVLYATAVSFYTVVNFALWADFSTPQTISRNAAVGVAFAGWAATFVSTALAIHWQHRGVSLVQHLRWVDALALLFLLGMLAWRVVGRR